MAVERDLYWRVGLQSQKPTQRGVATVLGVKFLIFLVLVQNKCFSPVLDGLVHLKCFLLALGKKENANKHFLKLVGLHKVVMA